jgi:hypothetical protein
MKINQRTDSRDVIPLTTLSNGRNHIITFDFSRRAGGGKSCIVKIFGHFFSAGESGGIQKCSTLLSYEAAPNEETSRTRKEVENQ